MTHPIWTEMLRRDYGLTATLRKLDGEYDENFEVLCADGTRCILKVMRPGCDLPFIEMQVAALDLLSKDQPFPQVVAATDGRQVLTLPDDQGRDRLVWLLTALPGEPLAGLKTRTPELLREMGAGFALSALTLQSFDHPQLDRPSKWRLQDGNWIAGHLCAISDPVRRARLQGVVDRFNGLKPTLDALPVQAIHNDFNDYNILVDRDPEQPPSLSGLIDMGDMDRAPVICDLAIAAAYLVLDRPFPLRDLEALVAGFNAVRPLSEVELDLLFPLIETRLAVSVVNSTLMAVETPDDPYVLISQAPAWRFLERNDVDADLAKARCRVACGYPVVPGADRVAAYLDTGRGQFAAVIAGDLAAAPVADLSVEGALIPENPFDLSDAEAAALVPPEMEALSLGRYSEPRLIYTDPAFANGQTPSHGRRTVHIGVDVFAVEGSPVRAPLRGEVVTVENRNGHLDYGGLVILCHETPDGHAFYTMYGHLAADVVNTLNAGQIIEAGEAFARLGSAAENGGWTPHLHLQLAMTLDGLSHDWPGVVDPQELAFFQRVFPNPAALLNLPDARIAHQPISQPDIAAQREDRFGENLRLSYRNPAMFLRGWQHHLFDQMGRPFLDAYNNVPHVGHAHPRIRAIAADQLARMNSNTRYLHPSHVRFADKVLSKMPDGLSVCYFVNSGTEANELALRLVRAHTGGKDMVVPDHGYHGNTTGAIDLSAYKFNKPNGSGQQDWVHLIEVADDYRGSFRRDDPDRADRFAALVDDALVAIDKRGGKLAGFIAETFPSVGGQIIPPKGYLQGVYQRIRAAGGVCIADEVQTGLGRLGDYYFGFEQQEVVPDIVVLGKPLGNGHPMGAVITRPEIAESFANGIEFFSTFGGSNLSCRTGHEVLQIVDDEGLQDNARAMGRLLMDHLRDLQGRHDAIGDVRGVGLFVGVDLVTDRDSRAPATELASWVSNAMRLDGVLIGTEGPADNILKIRPPLTIDAEGIGRIVDSLDLALNSGLIGR